MPTRLTFVFIIAIILFTYSKRTFTRTEVPKPIESYHHFVLQKLPSQPNVTGVWTSLITGVTKYLPKEENELLKELYLSHLLTPSGVHFSALMIALSFLLKPLRGFWGKVRDYSVLLIYLFPLTLTGFQAMKRSSMYSFLAKLPITKKIGIGPYFIFLLLYLFDFFFGTYAELPQSFNYSFIFLGAVFSSLGKGMKTLFLALIGGQAIAAYFSGGLFNPLALLFGFKLTMIFELIFPFLFLFYWIPWQPILYLGHFLMMSYLQVCHWAASLSHLSPQLAASLPTVVAVVIFSLKLPHRPKLAFLMAALVVSPVTIDNLKPSKKEIIALYNHGPVKSQKYLSKGVSVRYENGIRCSYFIYEDYYRPKCSMRLPSVK